MAWLFEFSPPEAATKGEVQDLIEPFREELTACILRGYADWFSFMAEEGRRRTKSCSMSMCVNNLIEERVKEVLGDKEGIVPCQRDSFFKLYVRDKIILRFKKLTDDYLVMPPRTDQGRDWFCNQPIDGIPNNLTRVTAGWRIMPHHQEIIDVAITFQLSTKTLGWQFSILKEADIRKVYLEYSDDVQELFPIPLKLKPGAEKRKSV